MQQPLKLSQEEKMRFMRALYSIFFRDNHINSVERSVLQLLNQCFNISTSDYQHYVHVKVDGIAKEINAIRDVRVRVYFMRIIHDVYVEEPQRLLRGDSGIFGGVQGLFNGSTDDEKEFETMYAFLQDNIDLKGL